VTSLTEVPGEPSSAVTGPGGALTDQLDGGHPPARPRGRAPRRTRWDVYAGDGTCGEYVTQADYDGQDHQHAA